MSETNLSREPQTVPVEPARLTRRTLFAAATAMLPAASALAARDYGPNAEPVRYPEPDVVVLDKSFAKYKIGNSPIQRLARGFLWAEGCAWNGSGKYLVFSDIPNNIQVRWLEDDGHVSTLRTGANNSNGNTFDYQGRQISFEHLTGMVARYEYDGTRTVLADKYGGKDLNAPNDGAVHPDGSVWFTDPGYGAHLDYEGKKRPLAQKEAIYRIDGKDGKITKLTDEIFKPNGLCFSPDYKKVYVADTGASHYDNAPKNIKVWDIVDDGKKVARGKEFTSMELNGKAGFADGIRADTDGNIWASAGWVGDGYDGVHIFNPQGQRIGQILLPEICGNVCFGGTKRTRLFMCGSQSLYAVYVEAKGAHIC